MRYLTTYKLFESKLDIESTVRDILLDLTDEGYYIDLLDRRIGHVDHLVIEVGKYHNVIASDEKVKEVIDRIVDFLRQENYTLFKHEIKFTDLSSWEFKYNK